MLLCGERSQWPGFRQPHDHSVHPRYETQRRRARAVLRGPPRLVDVIPNPIFHKLSLSGSYIRLHIVPVRHGLQKDWTYSKVLTTTSEYTFVRPTDQRNPIHFTSQSIPKYAGDRGDHSYRVVSSQWCLLSKRQPLRIPGRTPYSGHFRSSKAAVGLDLQMHLNSINSGVTTQPISSTTTTHVTSRGHVQGTSPPACQCVGPFIRGTQISCLPW